MDPLFSAIETRILGKWNMDSKKIIRMAPPPPPPRENNGFEMEIGSSSRNPNTGETTPPPGLRKIMTRIWEMDPLFCTRKKWAPVPLEHGPKENKIIMAPALPPPPGENKGIKMENGSIIFCYRNPNTEEMEHGPKEIHSKMAHPLPPDKIMDSKWKMDPLHLF